MVTLFVHQRTEAFVGGDETFGLLFRQFVECFIQPIEEAQFVLKETRPSFRAEVAAGASLGQQRTRLLVVEMLAIIGSAPPAPEEHLLGDDLMAAPALFDDVAAAEEQQRGLDVDLLGSDDGGAGRAPSLAGNGVGHDQLAELLHEVMIAAEVVVPLGRGRLEADLDELTLGQKAAKLGRQVAGDDAEVLLLGGDLDAEERGERAGHEVLHRAGIADDLVHGAQVFLNLRRLDGVLGEDAAGGLLTLGGLVDLARDVLLGLGGLVEVAEIEECALLQRLNVTVGVQGAATG